MYLWRVFDAVGSAFEAYDGRLSDYYFLNQCMRIICEIYGTVLLGIMDYSFLLLVLRFDAEEQPWRTLGHDPWGFIMSKYTKIYDVGSTEVYDTQEGDNSGNMDSLDVLNGTTPGQEPNYRLVLRRYGKGARNGIERLDGWKIFGLIVHWVIHDARTGIAAHQLAEKERGIEDPGFELEHLIIYILSLVPMFFSGQTYYDHPGESIIWLIVLEHVNQMLAKLVLCRLEEDL
ncbi:hypothetical protein SGCOL_006782 [Colletotrichum sp. CLE4]